MFVECLAALSDVTLRRAFVPGLRQIPAHAFEDMIAVTLLNCAFLGLADHKTGRNQGQNPGSRATYAVIVVYYGTCDVEEYRSWS
jgi:hypothetical protein